jgi:hypothetical protein
MPGLDPGIHQIFKARWIAGSSPAMTLGNRFARIRVNDDPTQRRVLHRSGTHRALFMILKPQAADCSAAVRVR